MDNGQRKSEPAPALVVGYHEDGEGAKFVLPVDQITPCLIGGEMVMLRFCWRQQPSTRQANQSSMLNCTDQAPFPLALFH